MSISWYPLAESDPVPGDPWTVTQAGTHYEDVANAISDARDNLVLIAELDGMRSEAVAEIRTKAQKVAEQIISARRRYTEVSGALTDYGISLTTAQADSLDLLRRARLTQQRIDDAGTADYRANAALDSAAPEDQEARQADVLSARSESQSALAALVSLKGDLEVVKQSRDAAAQKAMNLIAGVVGSDNLNDGWWANWGSKVAHAVSEIAGSIAGIAGILSLVLCWVPVLGQALAAVALIAGAVALLADLALASAGEGSWKTVIVGVLGLVTLGVGRAVGSSLKIASSAAKVSAYNRITKAAFRAGRPGMSARRAFAGLDDIASARKVAAPFFRGSEGVKGVLKEAFNPKLIVGKAFDDIANGVRFGVDKGFRATSGANWQAVMSQVGDEPLLNVMAHLGRSEAAVNLSQLSALSDDFLRSTPAVTNAMYATSAALNTAFVVDANSLAGKVTKAWDYGAGAVQFVSDGFQTPSTADKLNLSR